MRNYSLNLKLLFYLILVYPFFKPYFLSQMGVMPIVNDILYILSFLVILCLYISKFPYLNINKGFLFILIYYILILFSTGLNNSLNLEYYLYVAICLGFGLLINYTIGEKKELLNFLLSINVLTYIYIIINLICMFLYPNGIPSITDSTEFPYYLFGNTNNVIKYALPGLCFSFLYDSLKYKRIRKRSWILLSLVWLSLIMAWSVTSMIGLFIFTIIVLNKIGKKQIFFTYISMLIGSIVLTLFLVFFKYESNILATILGFFGKDLTFTNRDSLWMNAVDSIKNSPIWGHGFMDAETIRYFIGSEFGSHNYFLDTLFRGGFISLVLLTITLFYLSKKLFRSKGNQLTRTLIGTCSAYFIMWAAEPFISTEHLMFGILFILTFRVDTLLNYYNEDYKSTNNIKEIKKRINLY